MPRHARIFTDCLHVILRGNGKQILFEEDEDRYFFLGRMNKYRDECQIVIVAYCLMDNHVHLLIGDMGRNIQLFMKKLEVSYAGYYNKKYEHTGHLFEGRYKSECVVNDYYLLSAYRYIMNNPVKAGLGCAKDYRWSSYREFGRDDGISDTSVLRGMLGSTENFNEFMAEDDTTTWMDHDTVHKDDAWAAEVLKSTLHVQSGVELQQWPKEKRDEAIVLLLKNSVKQSQISRLTGINRGVIKRISQKSV